MARPRTSPCCAQYGVPYEVLDRAGFVAVEPGLRDTQHKFVGALRLPGDETGDCHLFTQRLAAMAAARGARLRFDTTILGLERDRRAHQRRAHHGRHAGRRRGGAWRWAATRRCC